jgi:hypothetical protein
MNLTCYADQGKQLTQCTITGKETWVNHPQPGNPSTAPSIEIQNNVISKKDHGICLLG